MKVILYNLYQTLGLFCVSRFLISSFHGLTSFFLYISLISEPFPAFPPEMTGEFFFCFPTLMIVMQMFTLPACCPAQLAAADLLWLCLYCDRNNAQELHIYMFLLWQAESDPLSVRRVCLCPFFRHHHIIVLILPFAAWTESQHANENSCERVRDVLWSVLW